jgi:hypothetical protein
MSTTCDLCGKLRGVEEYDLRHDFTQPGYPPSIMLCSRCYDMLDSMPPVFSWETAKQALLTNRRMSRSQRNKLDDGKGNDFSWDWDDLFSNRRSWTCTRRGSFHGKLRPEYEPKVFDHSPVPFGHVSIAPVPEFMKTGTSCLTCTRFTTKRGCAGPGHRNGHPNTKYCPDYEEALRVIGVRARE